MKKRTKRRTDGGPVSQYLREHFRHYNAGTTIDAADAYLDLMEEGGAMMLSLAGAMSTAELGRSLADMIRRDKVQLISCTGANLEEDVFNLVGRPFYEPLPDYQDLTKQDEQALHDAGKNRVTDQAIPDKEVMEPVIKAVLAEWKRADRTGARYFPHEFLYEVLRSGALKDRYKANPKDSWLLAASEKDLPICTFGWEDSTLGNEFSGAVQKDQITDGSIIRPGYEIMPELSHWYLDTIKTRHIGFFQIGGGIAGDGPICVVPYINETLKKKVRRLDYFCQISDAEVSYGGYSGAFPNEKITWGKLDEKSRSFNVKSDATIVAPLIFALVLGR